MSKLLTGAVGALAALFIPTAATAQYYAMDGGTTRIEPRPFYGASVSIEAGVRVFRPMPSTNRVIVNPNGATPLSLGFNETNVYERSYNYHKHDYENSGGYGGNYGGAYYFGRPGIFRPRVGAARR
jgi:hypothetical protein